ncbi:hypothetical protein Bbelb_191330 [Branchiostoma belcheri]|nr:hypothetical protein Bbelb_191330 [Branchiostoma belcheri]
MAKSGNEGGFVSEIRAFSTSAPKNGAPASGLGPSITARSLTASQLASRHITARYRVLISAHSFLELFIAQKINLEAGPGANFVFGPCSVSRSKGDIVSCGPKGGPSVRYSPCIIIMATAGQQTNVKALPPRCYHDRSYRHGFHGAVSDLQKSDVLQDVVLEVEGRRFPCHRLVLSAPTSGSGARAAILIPHPPRHAQGSFNTVSDGVATCSPSYHGSLPGPHLDTLLPKITYDTYRPRDKFEAGPCANFGLGPCSVSRAVEGRYRPVPCCPESGIQSQSFLAKHSYPPLQTGKLGPYVVCDTCIPYLVKERPENGDLTLSVTPAFCDCSSKMNR